MAKTALVTGCLGAMGKAISLQLAAEGYSVIGTDRADDRREHVGPYIRCELSDIASIEAMLEKCSDYARDISVVVNNAGLYEPKDFFDVTLADFDRVMTVNVTAIFMIGQRIARWMIDADTEGSIINIASVNGRLGSLVIPYGTSKSAVIGLTKSMARALATRKIRVNAIAPGVIETPMSAAVASDHMKQHFSNVAMERKGQPSEIAKVVSFLASNASSYMTGSIVDVNGGWPV